MVGLPASGKSTVAKSLSKKYSAKIYSSDDYRAKLLGDENDQSNNQLVFDTLYKDIHTDIGLDNNVILDATNVSVKSRARLLSMARQNECHTIAYVMQTSVNECIDRDSKRERHVGKDVIWKFVLRFQMPQYHEGFDEIILHDYPNSLPVFSPYLLLSCAVAMSDFDQKNPHHKNDLYTHCVNLAENYTDTKMYQAGMLHDVGKYFTQKIDDEGIAHYYGHESCSAYWVLSHPTVLNVKSLDEFLDILFYINEHMHIRDILKSNKAVKRYTEMFGSEKFNMLVEFMEHDNLASK